MVDEVRLNNIIEETLNKEGVWGELTTYAEDVEDELLANEVVLGNVDEDAFDVTEWNLWKTREGDYYLSGTADLSTGVEIGFKDLDDWRGQTYTNIETGVCTVAGKVSFSVLLDSSFDILKTDCNYIEDINGSIYRDNTMFGGDCFREPPYDDL